MLAFKPARPTDHRFVVKTFLDSYRKSHYAGLIPYKQWGEVMAPIATELLLGNRCIVACHPDEESTDADVYGWIAVKEQPIPIVLYIYIKGMYRGMNLAKQLFKAVGIDPKGEWSYGASTKHCRQIQKEGLIPNAKFDPLLLRK